jgi:hypothetical protein
MDATALVERYVAIWNEPDDRARRARIRELWAEDGAHFSLKGEFRGHDAIAAGVARIFDRCVAQGEFSFRALDTVDAHHGTVKFNWALMPVGGGMARWVGLDFIVLDEEGRITADYEFIEP